MPQYLIDIITIRGFQTALTKIVKGRCMDGHQAWQKFYDANYHYIHVFELRFEHMPPGGES